MLSELRPGDVRIASAPLASVTELVIESFGHPQGTPRGWILAVREALAPADLTALGPVFAPEALHFVPDCLLPKPETCTVPFGEEHDRLAAVSPDVLVAELAGANALDSTWSCAARSPRRWLDAYRSALTHAWPAVKPRWQQSAALFDAEAQRVGLALAHGAFGQVIESAHPAGTVLHDRWMLPCQNTPADVASDLVLVPMLIGPKASLLVTTNGQVGYLAYSLSRSGLARRPARRDTAATAAGLDSLLGTPRARILRGLDRPAPVGTLAAELNYVPSAITHHVTFLETAGLVLRQHSGRRTLVVRTTRGTQLLHLYEP